MPKVSIVLPVYNGQRYLKSSIESILHQTFEDFELIVIDDGSTDNSVKIIQSFCDPRLRLLQNGQNRGLICALNTGVRAANAEYIARMDADDVSLPTRLEEQARFMDNNPRVAVCGSWVSPINTLVRRTRRYPVDPEVLRCQLLFDNPITHPSVLMRKSSIDEENIAYDPRYPHAEDYELWVRLARKHQLSVIPKTLLKYRLNSLGVSRKYTLLQRESALRVVASQLDSLGIRASEQELECHRELWMRTDTSVWTCLDQLHQWFKKLTEANNCRGLYPPFALEEVLKKRWESVCFANLHRGRTVRRALVNSEWSRKHHYATGEFVRNAALHQVKRFNYWRTGLVGTTH